MTNTPYHVLNLVQLEGVAEWYVAIPQPPAEKNEATGNELTAQKRLLLLTLLDLVQTLGRGLQQALVAALDQEESLYIEHDFLAHQVQARLRQAGVKADVWEDSEEDTGEATTWTGPKH